MKQPEYVDATFYAVVEPVWHPRWKDDQDRKILEGARVEKITKNRPASIRGDAVVTRLTLRVSVSALLPLQPEAIITVEPGQTAVFHADAVDPGYPPEPEGDEQ